MLSGGIYHKSSLRPPQGGRIVNTWVGDPHKTIMLEAVSIYTIRACLLFECFQETSYSGAKQIF